MPPSPQAPLDTDHQPPPARKKVGPLIGIIIIIFLLVIGALYFWGAQLNHQGSEQVPYIPAGTTTVQVSQ